MNRAHLLLCVLLVGALFPGQAETIVQPEDQVSVFDARRELVHVLRNLGETAAAQVELRKLLQSRPNDPGLLADLADLEASRGHFARSRELYERAISKSENASELRLRYARQAQSWGDFYRSEKLFHAYVGEHPKDLDTALDLAGVLVAEQRYEAAEGKYRALAENPSARRQALTGLATSRLLEKDYHAVLPITSVLLQTDPNQVEALDLRAEAFRALRRYDEAEAIFSHLSTLIGGRRLGWIGLGRAARAQKDESSAKEYFRRAQESGPKDITLRYLIAGDHAAEAVFAHEIIAQRGLTAAELTALAGLYSSDGHLDAAIAIYQAGLTKDPDYFPAQIELAEVLATAHRYDESIELLTRLRDDFPGDAKIALSLARVFSWSRRYDRSIQAYRELSALNPADMVPRKEMARVASWSKQMNLAGQLYAEIYTPSVDDRLIKALQSSHHDDSLLHAVETLPGDTKSPYEKYERVSHLLDAGGVPRAFRPSVEEILSDLLPVYRVQKSIWLESRAKRLAWSRKFLLSEGAYRELAAVQPGNEEAWFDLAQVQAAQELSLESTASYHQLLELDPLHNLASEALERQSIRQDPAIFTKYTYWDEKGIGRASDIERQHFQSGAEFTWNGQTQLRLSGDYWLESPGSGGTAGAVGATIGIRTVFNQYWRASAEWSHKEYFDSRFDPTNTGHADLTFNAWDYVHLTLQYARDDELHNEFGLDQGVQSDNLRLAFDSDLNHYVEVSGGATWTHYTDNNHGLWLSLAPAFILIDHPHTLKLVLRGDYRNTKSESIFEYEGPRLSNIIHPYWTPQDYTQATVILEWRHDLSRDFFAGSQQHYYALRVGGGIDSTGNKNLLLEAEWRYEFLQHWTLEAHGTLNRSPAWDGATAFLSVTYRF
jgi:predicted Zn-dependent protease